MLPDPRSIHPAKPSKWRKDAEADRCVGCNLIFTLLRRRHHCRGCGDVLCDDCSQMRRPLPHFGFWTAVRVCRPCASPQIATIDDVPTYGGATQIVGFNMRPAEFPTAAIARPQRRPRSDSSPKTDASSRRHRSSVNLRGALVGESKQTVLATRLERVGQSRLGLRVFVEGVHCPHVWVPGKAGTIGSMINCMIPPGIGVGKSVVIEVDGLRGIGSLNYLPPIITHCEDVATTGGFITITGDNLGDDASSVIVLVPRGPRGAITSLGSVELCTPHRAIRVFMPAGVGRGISLIVQVAGQSSPIHKVSYMPPCIAGIVRLEAKLADSIRPGFIELRIDGCNFGSKNADITVQVDDVTVEARLLVPHLAIVTAIPSSNSLAEEGDGHNIHMCVIVGGQRCDAVFKHKDLEISHSSKPDTAASSAAESKSSEVSDTTHKPVVDISGEGDRSEVIRLTMPAGPTEEEEVRADRILGDGEGSSSNGTWPVVAWLASMLGRGGGDGGSSSIDDGSDRTIETVVPANVTACRESPSRWRREINKGVSLRRVSSYELLNHVGRLRSYSEPPLLSDKRQLDCPRCMLNGSLAAGGRLCLSCVTVVCLAARFGLAIPAPVRIDGIPQSEMPFLHCLMEHALRVGDGQAIQDLRRVMR